MKISFEKGLFVKESITQKYGEFLRQQSAWTLWFNASFRTPPSYLTAKKKFKKFFKYLNKRKEFYSGYVHCYVFYERHNNSDNIHIHALIDRIDPKHAQEIQRLATKKFGLSEVKAYDPKGGAAFYLAKKINSDNLVEYERYVINSRVRRTGIK